MENLKEDKYFEVLLCKYGYFTLTKFIADLYLTYRREIDPNFNYKYPDSSSWNWEIERDDPILLKLYHEYKDTDKLQYKNFKFVIEEVPKKYIGYYHIRESEMGPSEYIDIDYNKYKNDTIKKILFNTLLSDSEKVDEIKDIIDKTVI